MVEPIHPKNSSQIGSSPQVGAKKTNLKPPSYWFHLDIDLLPWRESKQITQRGRRCVQQSKVIEWHLKPTLVKIESTMVGYWCVAHPWQLEGPHAIQETKTSSSIRIMSLCPHACHSTWLYLSPGHWQHKPDKCCGNVGWPQDTYRVS